MSLTHDVLLEVLEHLRYDITADDRDEIRGKRKGLLNMALLSRSLISRALDMLWMGMETLQPVVSVINSFASPEEGAFIEYDGSACSWVVGNQIGDNDVVRSRAKEYLGRIRTFYITHWNLTELSLWRVLTGCVGRSVLLPKLRELELYSPLAPLPPPMDLLPLFSPTISTLTISHGTFGASNAQILFKLFSSSGYGLKKMTYVGSSSPTLLLDFMPFKNLQFLRIAFGDDSLVQRESTVPVSQVLKHFTSLNTLHIDLRMFPGRGAISSPPIHHASLEALSLAGDAEDLQDFFLNQLTSPSLHTLSLLMYGVQHLSWRLLCKRAASSFPYLRSVTLLGNGSGETPLQYQDLLPVLSNQLTTLHLRSIVNHLTTADLVAMIRMLPNLQELFIIGAPHQEFGASVLVPLSQCPHIRKVGIYLDFSDFRSPLPTVGLPSRSKLTKLDIKDPKGSPLTPEESGVTARNLLALFPILRTTNSKPRTNMQTALMGELRTTVACCYFLI